MQDHTVVIETSVALMAKIGACWSPSFSPGWNTTSLYLEPFWPAPSMDRCHGRWLTGTGDGPRRSTHQCRVVARRRLARLRACARRRHESANLCDPSGTGLHRLTAGGTDNNWLGPWTHDGQSLAIASNQRSANALDAYVVDVTSGDLRHLTENRGIGRFTDISRDG